METYSVVCFLEGKERVLESGLTREMAERSAANHNRSIRDNRRALGTAFNCTDATLRRDK